MRAEERDIAYLWDMRKAAREILEFTQGATYDRFVSQKTLHYAVERLLMVIGEAARKVSDAFKDAHPEIPWAGIIGQRNVLAHEYGEILLERIWRAVTERIPELIRLLDPLIPLEPEEEEEN